MAIYCFRFSYISKVTILRRCTRRSATKPLSAIDSSVSICSWLVVVFFFVISFLLFFILLGSNTNRTQAHITKRMPIAFGNFYGSRFDGSHLSNNKSEVAMKNKTLQVSTASTPRSPQVFLFCTCDRRCDVLHFFWDCIVLLDLLQGNCDQARS